MTDKPQTTSNAEKPNKIEQASTNEKKNNSSKVFLILSILLFLACGYLLKLYLDQKELLEQVTAEKNEVISEKDLVKMELEKMLKEYELLETDNEELKAEIEAEKAKIKDLLDKIDRYKYSLYKAKKEADRLREILKQKYVEIDSLNTANKILKQENQQITQELTTQKTQNQELSQVNQELTSKVTVASRLKTINLQAYAIKVKESNNTSKPTTRASKADKIRIKFIILKNEVTPPGKKWLYARILGPDGKVLAEGNSDEYKFEFNGVMGLYSIKQQIDYQNEEMQVQMDWTKIDDFLPGEYNVEIYESGVDIGRTKFELK
jgi:hypothetical protein